MESSQRDVDWQSTKKTVLERSRHMFNNPVNATAVIEHDKGCRLEHPLQVMSLDSWGVKGT